MKDSYGNNEQYPSAPPAKPRKVKETERSKDHLDRAAWFAKRNEMIQKGVKRGPNAPKDGSFGGIKKE